MVDDTVTKKLLERALKDWAIHRARMKVKRDDRRQKRKDLRVNDGLYSRAHSSASRWLNKMGISQEQQEAIAEQGAAVASDIAARRTAIEAAKAAERERARIEAEREAEEAEAEGGE